MLVNLKTILSGLDKKAVGSFNIYSYETIHGVCRAVEKTGKPAIISFGASYLNNMSLGMVKSIVDEAVKGLPADTALHLDHCKDTDIIKAALEAGFTSVMYDGSALPFDENVKNSRAVANMAHARGVSVEAELGSIALGQYSNESDIDHGEAYTNPANAAEFANVTGVDALAVSIGTVHGMYKAEPNIRIDILREISKMVSIPLVLHGGSGTPEEKIKECIENGIKKINVNTEISQYTVKRLADIIAGDRNIHLSKLTLMQSELVSEVVEKYITLFAER
ncbi:class II fructose-bisphosphate aldolase [Lachnospiraceae bacterium NSJ-143]|nr:class II fructose-bisphosphate aldolase [Lachnospiraceae bacterium NSJ-143]